jgi:ferric-dicitrate binding protein FerR (iron transport regulator)
MKKQSEPAVADEEQQIERLLRASGSRPLPPAGMAAAVRGPAHAAWRETVARRRRSRQQTTWRLAAGFVLTAGLALWLISAQRVTAPVTVASLDTVTGRVETSRDTAWTPGAAAQALATGQEIRTAPDARALLVTEDGLSIRMDGGTQLAWIAPDRLELKRGSAYVDTGSADEKPGSLVIETRFGQVRHLGTRYLVTVEPNSFTVGVREGRVAMLAASQQAQATRGEQLSIREPAAGDNAVIQRSAIPTWGPLWTLAEESPAPFDIDGQPVSEFLNWATDQSGRELRYASAAAESQARMLTLRGNISGLNPQDALAAVMPTTPLDYRLTDDGGLEVSLRD